MTRKRAIQRAIIGIIVLVNALAAYRWWTTGTYDLAFGYMCIGIGAHTGLFIAYVRWTFEVKNKGE